MVCAPKAVRLGGSRRNLSAGDTMEMMQRCFVLGFAIITSDELSSSINSSDSLVVFAYKKVVWIRTVLSAALD
jgi:hypothetical protein